MAPQIRPAGDRALLVDLGAVDVAELHARARSVRRREDVLACIVGAESLYVIFDRPAPQRFELSPADDLQQSAREHDIAVRFDGPDLPELLARIPESDFLRRVDGLVLTARYLGFRAGFAYLDGWPAEWALPRHGTSRPVKRGSFGIAAAMAGFYPIDSPGGWKLLGRTDAPLWDVRRQPPNLIGAGDRVRLQVVHRAIEPPDLVIDEPAIDLGAKIDGRFFSIVKTADWTRVAEGRAEGGPFDPEAAARANALVGNDAGAPVIECALVGPRVTFAQPRLVAWCGAEADVPRDRPFTTAEVNLGRIRNGLRGWLAISSGPISSPATAIEPLSRNDHRVIQVVAGPHDLGIETIECVVQPQLDRVGIRLRPAIDLAGRGSAALPSCGMQFGTIQLHPDGTLVAMGPDHPVTGGYSQAFTVRWDERWKLAQLTPGERITLACA